MRKPSITDEEALRARRADPAQGAEADAPLTLPAYLEAFLAQLRLLMGVPFAYLVPHPSLLPDESIRFFHIDRSFTDRLVDGALSVGASGTREQASVRAHYEELRRRLDADEAVVAQLTRRAASPFADLLERTPPTPAAGDGALTGFLLRSSVVSGWPQLAVRAFAGAQPLPLLRLERLQPSVLLAIFAGLPTRIECEEPHHAMGLQVPRGAARREHALRGVVDVRALAARQRVTTSSGLAASLLAAPWRQRFEGGGGTAAMATRRQAELEVPVAAAPDMDTLAVRP